jgi:hypothetical protein
MVGRKSKESKRSGGKERKRETERQGGAETVVLTAKKQDRDIKYKKSKGRQGLNGKGQGDRRDRRQRG